MADEKSQLETLTDQMKGWQVGAGGVDLQITPAGRKVYDNAINALRAELTYAQSQLVTLKCGGSVGNYDDATGTRSGLEENAETLDATLTGYLAYLDSYQQTVKDAFERMNASG